MMQGRQKTVFSFDLKIIYFVTARILISLADEDVAKESASLKYMFFGYDRNVRPNFNNGPVHVVADLYIESFGNIQEANMEYTVYGYFRQSWVDSRLAGKFNHTVVLQSTVTDYAWLPDTYCSNARQSNLRAKGSISDSVMHVKPNGSIFFSTGVRLVSSCDMSLHDFPLDQQQCILSFFSYGYTADGVLYNWAKDSITVERKAIAQFHLDKVQLEERIVSYTTGDFSQLTIRFDFHRRVGYYVMQVYAPDFLVVAISWTLFWMDKHDMNTRMAVGITTILTIVFLLGSANASLPRVSYPKAIDWYLVVSFTFIFAALLECMLVFHFRSDGTKKAKKNQSCQQQAGRVSERLIAVIKHRLKRGSFRIDDVQPEAPSPTDHKAASFLNTLELLEEGTLGCTTLNNVPVETELRFPQDTSDKIDLASRYLFPLSFLLFNIVYWFTYVHDIKVLSDSSLENF